MRLLLDTHTLLWFLEDDPRLSARAKTAVVDPANERRLSPISLPEIAIKVKLGKLRLADPFAVVFPAQRTAFKHFLSREWDKAKAEKRGGGRSPIPLDFLAGESRFHAEPSANLAAEQVYDRQ